MGNRNIVIDGSGTIVGEYQTSLACFALVMDLVRKYNAAQSLNIFNPEKINAMLEPVYERCQPWEMMVLLLFINDESEFDQSDIPALDEAIQKYSYGHDGPKKHLVFIRKLLDKYQTVKTRYMDTTMAITVGRQYAGSN